MLFCILPFNFIFDPNSQSPPSLPHILYKAAGWTALLRKTTTVARPKHPSKIYHISAELAGVGSQWPLDEPNSRGNLLNMKRAHTSLKWVSARRQNIVVCAWSACVLASKLTVKLFVYAHTHAHARHTLGDMICVCVCVQGGVSYEQKHVPERCSH